MINVILLKWKRVVMRQKDADLTNIVDPDLSAQTYFSQYLESLQYFGNRIVKVPQKTVRSVT